VSPPPATTSPSTSQGPIALSLWSRVAWAVTSHKKTLAKVLQGTADANIRFGDLRSMLAALGFEERIKGGHHIFTLEGREAALNLQPEGSKAKAYQVRQVRQIVIEHGLASDEEHQ
jgi:hypothetical protein